MISVILNEGEFIDSAIRRLKRLVEKSGILRELRQRERYEKPAKKRQREKMAAKKRELKRQRLLFTYKQRKNTARRKVVN